MRILSVALLMCALPFLAVAGCGTPKAEGPELAPVSGTVKLDGKPLAEASVVFSRLYRGTTDANGHYELTSGDKKGAPVGEHQVVCEKWVMADGSLYKGEESPMTAGAKQLLPPRYSDDAATELKANVPAGGGTFDFDLQSK